MSTDTVFWRFPTIVGTAKLEPQSPWLNITKALLVHDSEQKQALYRNMIMKLLTFWCIDAVTTSRMEGLELLGRTCCSGRSTEDSNRQTILLHE